MAPNNLHQIAFPKLDEAQIASLSRCAHAKLRKFSEGDKLFTVGEREPKFYIVKSGEIEIVDESGEKPKTVTVHHPGDFTGDVSQLTGNPVVVSAVAHGDCEAYEISAEALRALLNTCPELSDIILQAFIARRQLLRESSAFTGLRVIGSRYSQDTFRTRDFLSKNRVLYTWLDLENDPQVKEILKAFNLTEKDTPVVACGRKLLLRNPSNRELAEAIGIRRPLEKTVYDLVVVGAGPAGLAAAVYGASEGLSTVVVDRIAAGGQAGLSMRIENYLGFPTGITGSDLADRAVLQANKFGAHLSVPSSVLKLSFDNAYSVLEVEGGETIVAKCLLVATGAQYRRLEAQGCEQFEGSGVYYAATVNEAQLCRGYDVLVVGGGNSAGQAAVFLAGQVRKVFVIIRGDDLNKSMSSYLVQRIQQTPTIEVLYDTEVVKMHGERSLTTVELVNHKTGEKRTIETPALFSFIGAVPRTEWLPPEIERDDKQFIRTGYDLAQSPNWTQRRQPFLLETSRAGVLAAGDVRSGSVKRVASAVGEGAMAVQFVHALLKEM